MMPDSKIINSCLKILNFEKLEIYLNSVILTRESVGDILDIIYKSNYIVYPHPSENESKRDAFFSELDDYIAKQPGFEKSNAVSDLFSLVASIEKGYRSILEFESRLPSMSENPSRRVGLALGLLANVHSRIRQDIKRHLKNLKHFDPKAPIKDVDGNSYFPKDLYSGLSISCGRLIAMEAYREKWIEEDKVVVLPVPALNMQLPLDAGGIFSNLELATMWGCWTGVDNRVRYLDGELKVYTDEFPEWTPKDVREDSDLLFHFSPNHHAEISPLLAEFRFNEMSEQNFSRLLIASKQSHSARLYEKKSIKKLVYLEIKNAAATLKHSLSLPLEECRVLDITVLDLLHGYATLKRLSEEQAAISSIFPKFAHDELLDELLSDGLSNEVAKVFLSIATFKSNSRDFYDCPLLKCGAESYYLFGFSMIHADLARVVLSSISQLKVSFLEKGDAFESEMLSFFKAQGFLAKKIKVRRGRPEEEYDYDIVFVWCDYAFFVECKNRLLPAGSSISSHNFQNDIQDHVVQVNRLVQGLIDYPDIIEKEFPEAAGKKRVFCVLNALPYSVAASDHEIYFIDASMLRRFFESGTLNHLIVSGKRRKERSLSHNPVVTIWAGNRPTPEDFLRYLKFPPQLAFAAAHYEIRSELRQLGHRIFVRIDDYRLVHATPKMIRDQLAKHGW